MRSTLISHFDHDLFDVYSPHPYFLCVPHTFTTDFSAVRLTLVVLFDILATGGRPSIPDLGGGLDRQ